MLYGLFWFIYDPVGFLVTILATTLAYGAFITIIGPKMVAGRPRSMAQLSLHMTLTALLVVLGGLSLIYITVYALETWGGIAWTMSLQGLLILYFGVVVFFGLIQYALSPVIIRMYYKLRKPATHRELRVVRIVEELSKRAGIDTPKVWIADVNVPNAFAFSSFTSRNVAVTAPLLDLLSDEELSGVLGHELGHLRHKDVQVILVLSLIPVALYYLGRGLMFMRSSDRDDSGATLALGAALVAFGVIFSFIVRHFNRLREYYADAHSAILHVSPVPLQRALAKIHVAFENMKNGMGAGAVYAATETPTKMLLIYALVEPFTDWFYDPYNARKISVADIDDVVEELKNAKVSTMEELFATHPPIPKRLQFLDDLAMRHFS
ncbi:MAG: M48 family metalloprotease [Desulfurococcales archaeon]|nr:M48 family metalloprotease [Desulfurococcales archaeon]